MGKKIIRAATIGMSLNIFCRGLLRELKADGYEVVALSSGDADLEETRPARGRAYHWRAHGETCVSFEGYCVTCETDHGDG